MNNTNLSFHAGKDVLKHKKFMHLGFTLAEMMVVMLIMSIILAAMAPVMTTRARKMEEDRLSSTIWQWADNDTDIYFGFNPEEPEVSDTQKVMIGQNSALVNDLARLIINTSDDLPDYIRFNKDATTYGRLYMNDTSLTLGSGQGSGGGAQSTSIGIGALVNNTGASNTALGYNALNSNTTGFSNTAVGTSALQSDATGKYNTAVGYNTLSLNEGSPTSGNGNYNTAVGANSLSANQYGGGNVAIGYNSLASSVSGGSNVAIGVSSMQKSTRGYQNVAIGYDSLREGLNVSRNTAVGVNTMTFAEADEGESNRNINNTAVGHGALYGLNGDNNEGIGNTAIGMSSMGTLSHGNYNTVVGYLAMQDVGSDHGLSQHNIAIGTEALRGTTITSMPVSYNIAIGDYALQKAGTSGPNSNSNLAIGHESLKNFTRSTGSGGDGLSHGFNVMIGNHSGISLTSGTANVGVGYDVLKSVTTGSSNVALGNNACSNVTNGSGFICIGDSSGPSASSPFFNRTDGEHFYVGRTSRFNNGDAVLEVHNINDRFSWEGGDDVGGYDINGSGVIINGSLIVRGPILQTVKTTTHNDIWRDGSNYPIGIINYIGGGPTNTELKFGWANRSGSTSMIDAHPLSDRRLKYVGKEFTSGLDKIRQLKVFNYTFKKDEKKTPHVGVIAQDLQKVFPDAVKKGTDGFLQIRFEDMFYAVINAIKELDSRVTKLEQENKELKARIDRLESKLK